MSVIDSFVIKLLPKIEENGKMLERNSYAGDVLAFEKKSRRNSMCLYYLSPTFPHTPHRLAGDKEFTVEGGGGGATL